MNAIKILLAIVLVLNLGPSAHSQSLIAKDHKLTVKGTSSLHDWESIVNKVDTKGFFEIANNRLADIRDVTVKIPVNAIKSTKGKLMDTKTWEAFNHEKNPTITFVMTENKIDAQNNTLEAYGSLTMAGVTRPVRLHLTYKCLPDGGLRITGSHTLLMSEFKMEPPTAMMGTIKVGDQVVFDFDITLIMNNTL